MTAFTDDDVQRMTKALIAEGADADPGLHASWRCFDKVRYPEPCNCIETSARDILAAVAPAIAARALREAADAQATDSTASGYDADWLRARAEGVES